MKVKHYVLFTLLALVILGFYLFSRQQVLGADTPAFLMLSCQNPQAVTQTMLLTPLIYSFVPCNVFWFKAVAVLLLLASVLIIAKTGELVDKDWGWLAGLLAFSNALFIPELLELEEQTFAYPLMFAFSYFFTKWLLNNKKLSIDRDLLLSVTSLIATSLLWKGAYIYAFLYAPFLLLSLVFLVPAFLVRLTWWWDYFSWGFPFQKQLIQEAQWGFGIIHNWSLLLGALTKNKRIFIAICFTLFISFFSQKYTLYSVPFLAVGVLLWLKDNPNWKPFVIMIPIALIAISLIGLPAQNPTNEKIAAIKEVVELADGNAVMNDWGDGWWIKYYNGKTKYFAGMDFPDYNHSTGYALTTEMTSCQPIKDYNLPKGETLHLIKC